MEGHREMKRIAFSTLIALGILVFGFWTGRTSEAFSQKDAHLLEEMNQAVKQDAQAKEILFLREMVRREMELRLSNDPAHRYGGQPCAAAD